MEKLPFEITPQIRRYLEDIIFLSNELLDDPNGKGLVCVIPRFNSGEINNPRQKENGNQFFKYIEEKGGIKNVSRIKIADEIKNTLSDNIVFNAGERVNIAAIKRERGVSPRLPEIRYVLGRDRTLEKDSRQIAPPSYAGFVFKMLDIKFVEELLKKIEDKTAQDQQEKNKKIPSITLPDGTKWQDITIRFIDNGDNVEISTKEITKMASYQDMGFEDTRKRRPNAQWQFLRLLATPELNGELSWESLNAKGITSPREQTAYKKKKQLLAKTLKDYFQIREDPFHSYRKEKAYKIKMTLISTTDQQEVQQYEDDDDDLGVNEYLKEHMTSEYEGENNL